MAIRMDTKPPWMIKIHFGILPRMELLLQGLLTSPSVVVRKRPTIGGVRLKIIQTTHAMRNKSVSTTMNGDFLSFSFPLSSQMLNLSLQSFCFSSTSSTGAQVDFLGLL